MAVDATHFLTNTNRVLQGNHTTNNIYTPFPMAGYGFLQGPPSSGTSTATEALMPMPMPMPDSLYPIPKPCVKSESALSYALPLLSRKRPRQAGPPPPDAAVNNNHHHHQFLSSYPPPPGGPGFINQPTDYHRPPPPLNFLTEDFSMHFQQQQSEIDRLIAQHTLKVRIEMEEKRKYYSTRIITAVEDVIVKKLKAKDEEIDKMGKINWALQDKLKSLCLENQIWRELAQTNEATANALRTNLEQVLAHVQQEDQIRHNQIAAAAAPAPEIEEEDAESCCGSNHNNRGAVDSGESQCNGRMCRNCGKEEASVLIMPCRHLCLCYLCGPLLQNCPLCNTPKNVMVRVNLLPSF